LKQFADFFPKKFGGCLDCLKKDLVPKKIGFDCLSKYEINSHAFFLT